MKADVNDIVNKNADTPLMLDDFNDAVTLANVRLQTLPVENGRRVPRTQEISPLASPPFAS